MNLLGVIGDTGSGKDVILNKALQEFYSRKKRNIIANCWLNYPGVKILDNNKLYEKVRDKKHEFFRNSYLYISEMHLLYESRASTSNVNRVMTQLLTQLNKLDCKVLFNHQLKNQVDLRLREFVNSLIRCEKWIIRNGEFTKPDMTDDRILKQQIYIQLTLDYLDFYGDQQFDELGWYIPSKQDFKLFNTEEVFTFDRENYLVK